MERVSLLPQRPFWIQQLVRDQFLYGWHSVDHRNVRLRDELYSTVLACMWNTNNLPKGTPSPSAEHVDELWRQVDADHDNTLSANETKELVRIVLSRSEVSVSVGALLVMRMQG